MDKRLNIALVGPFEEQIPPRLYGGIERIVGDLAVALSFDHDVTLYAAGGSKPNDFAKVVACTDGPIRSLPEAHDPVLRQQLNREAAARAVGSIVADPDRFDVILNHFHPAGWLLQELEKSRGSKHLPPVISTLHCKISERDKELFRPFPNTPITCISNDQRDSAIEQGLHVTEVIYNGINPEKFKYYPTPNGRDLEKLIGRPIPERYLAFLGIMSVAKGAKTAIQIARRVGWPLVMGAKIDPCNRDFYKKEIEPLIDGKQIISLGEVGGETKAAFLGGATALVSPIERREPFGIVYIESMAAGTPPLVTKRGAVPEIVEDMKSGIVCDTAEEMVERFDEIAFIKRENCRRHVVRDFSAHRMAENYQRVIQRVIHAN